MYFIPIYLQFVQENTAIQAGVRLLPFICLAIFTLLLSGTVMGKTGLYMPWFVGGSAIVIIGAALMSTIDTGTTIVNIYGYFIILGLGVGSYCQASFAVAQAKVSRSEIPVAVAFIRWANISGICICFAVVYSVFLNAATNQIAFIVPSASVAQIQESIIGVGSELFANLNPDQEVHVLTAVNISIRNVWI